MDILDVLAFAEDTRNHPLINFHPQFYSHLNEFGVTSSSAILKVQSRFFLLLLTFAQCEIDSEKTKIDCFTKKTLTLHILQQPDLGPFGKTKEGVPWLSLCERMAAAWSRPLCSLVDQWRRKECDEGKSADVEECSDVSPSGLSRLNQRFFFETICRRMYGQFFDIFDEKVSRDIEKERVSLSLREREGGSEKERAIDWVKERRKEKGSVSLSSSSSSLPSSAYLLRLRSVFSLLFLPENYLSFPSPSQLLHKMQDVWGEEGRKCERETRESMLKVVEEMREKFSDLRQMKMREMNKEYLRKIEGFSLTNRFHLFPLNLSNEKRKRGKG